MPSEYLDDHEFGAIAIRRYRTSRSIRIRVDSGGRMTATMPPRTSLRILERMINDSRDSLRNILRQTPSEPHAARYRDGDIVGQTHRIILLHGGTSSSANLRGKGIYWRVPEGADPTSSIHQDNLRPAVRHALDREAKDYLPRRLQELAGTGNFHYTSVRFGNAKSRWGSCSSRATITLNVALMQLPIDLIDYVLLHELAHTKHMNHSPEFWSVVAQYYPDYKRARRQLKSYSPYI